MNEKEFWHGGMDNFYRHYKSFQYKQKSKMEESDYLAWRIGESVKSALETTAIISIMTDVKEAKKALKNAKYQEAPAYIHIKRQTDENERKKVEQEKLINWINNSIKPKNKKVYNGQRL